jgi:hypothetical protein
LRPRRHHGSRALDGRGAKSTLALHPPPPYKAARSLPQDRCHPSAATPWGFSRSASPRAQRSWGLCVLLGWVITAEAKETASTSNCVARLLNLAIDAASRSHRCCPEAEEPERPVNQRSSQAGAAERRGPRHAEDTASTSSLFRSAAQERSPSMPSRRPAACHICSHRGSQRL